MLSLVTYIFYFSISLLITFRVGARLNQYGLALLTNQLSENHGLASAVNNLLMLGFYLVNIGYILLILNLHSGDLMLGGFDSQFYFFTRNLGLVILMLGAVHMILTYVITHWHPIVIQSAEEH